jgi:hypothetical protein
MLLRVFRARTPITPQRFLSTPQRFLTSTPRLSIKETADRSPEQLEQKKNEQLRKQEQGKGEWHEELASQGESNIAADKQDVEDHGEHMKDLQNMGKRKGEKGEL